MSQAVMTSDGGIPNSVLTCSPRSWEKKPSPAPMSATRYPGFTRGKMSSNTLSSVLRCEIGRISFSDTDSVMHYRSCGRRRLTDCESYLCAGADALLSGDHTVAPKEQARNYGAKSLTSL